MCIIFNVMVADTAYVVWSQCIVIYWLWLAAHDLSVKPQAHMALRTSPAGDLYLPPPTPFLFMLSSFQALITFSIFISFSMLLNTTYNLPLKHIFIPMQHIMGASFKFPVNVWHFVSFINPDILTECFGLFYAKLLMKTCYRTTSDHVHKLGTNKEMKTQDALGSSNT